MTTKEIIIVELAEHFNEEVNGEKLASLCKVSRAAVWKAINSLRKEGCKISGTQNSGYKLTSFCDFYSAPLINYFITKNYPQYKNLNIEFFDKIDSTNLYAKQYISGTKNNFPALIAACSQTKGKGRLGRTFISPKNTGIYISIIYSPEEKITECAKITAFAAVAVRRAIKKLFDLNVSIKWINDLYFNEKKVCGILTEGTTNFETGTIDNAIIGIWINLIENKALKNEPSKIAGALFEKKCDILFARAKLTALITGEVLSLLEEINSTNSKNKIIEEYKSLSFLQGKTVEVHPIIDGEKSYKAKVLDIDENASLVVETKNGEIKKLISGEVTLHKN